MPRLALEVTPRQPFQRYLTPHISCVWKMITCVTRCEAELSELTLQLGEHCLFSMADWTDVKLVCAKRPFALFPYIFYATCLWRHVAPLFSAWIPDAALVYSRCIHGYSICICGYGYACLLKLPKMWNQDALECEPSQCEPIRSRDHWLLAVFK